MPSNLLSICLLFFLTITTTSSYHLPLHNNKPKRCTKMSMSENYLNRLQENTKPPIKNNIADLLKTAPEQTTDAQLNVTSIYVNIYKMQSIFFNRNSRSIMFSLPRELTELYYYKNDTLYKVSDNTKISMANVKHFVVTELDNSIDSLLF